jgi:PAS domain-containing protein
MSRRTNGEDPELGYYTWDVVENIVVLDTVSSAIFDFPPEQSAMGIPIEGFLEKIDEVTRRRVAKAIFDCLTEHNFYDEEYPIHLDNGEIRWVKVLGRMVIDADNQPLRGIGTIRDITRERLE